MIQLTVNAANFAEVRECLKAGNEVCVNNTITLVHYIVNTEYIGPSGKKTRTPFYYIAEDGTKYTSTTLKKVLGIECEKKGQRQETTFATVFDQVILLAQNASAKVLEDAITQLQEVAEARKANEKAAKEAERVRLLAALAALDEE